MKTIFIDINWLSVFVATISYSVFSGIWHKQFVFGRIWEKAMGFERPANWSESKIYYIVPSISCLATSVVVSLISNITNVSSFGEAVVLGLVLGIGIAGAVTFTNAVIPIMKRPLIFSLVTGSAHAIGITIVSVVIYLISK